MLFLLLKVVVQDLLDDHRQVLLERVVPRLELKLVLSQLLAGSVQVGNVFFCCFQQLFVCFYLSNVNNYRN